MFFLVALALSASLFLIFRSFQKFRIHTFQAIVFNYWTCVLTALVYLGDFSVLQNITWEHLWVKVPLGLGLLFISTFYLMGYVAQNISVAASSVASKISLIIPVIVNLIFFKHKETFDWLNYTGLILVFLAIFLTSYRSKNVQSASNTHFLKSFMLIVAIFLMSGAIDTSINWVSSVSATDKTSQALFSMLIFAIAGIVGALILAKQVIAKKTKITLPNILAGVILGVFNYFSVIFMMLSLQKEFAGNGAFFFPLFNIAIIVFSTFLAILLFKEKLNTANRLGILVAVLAILAMAHQHL
ncbi:hypothetical protein [Raineya orbicola]|jgi:drug/metabolite transporter (DMT)-like permease|uniref:EamA-like transporter family n=1 Tax=Raineya orbicola TaxID=2016530 RepID=A0A2N3IBE1_9BACT|nr:hypothetical protein [Raineya orbicola]PKQ67626.1 hypothetical protein Rain11_1971 [Raineya orbicola]